MKRKTCLVILPIILLLVLVACQPENQLPDEQTFTILITDINPKYVWESDEISKEIKRRTGINLEIEFLDTDIKSKMDSMLTLGKFPDIICSINNDNISYLASVDMLVPLDDFITPETNIYRIFGDDLEYMKDKADDKIYGVNRSYKAIPSKSEAVVFVQYEVLEYFGYPDITDLTMAELATMLETYKNKFEYINDHKTIGLSYWGDSYGMNITLNNPALRSGGYQNDGKYVVDGDLNVKYGLKTEEAKEFFAFLNTMNNAGLLDPEGMVQDRALFTEKVSTGAVLAVMTEYWDLEDGEALLRENGMGNRCYIPIPVKLNDDTDISGISAYDAQGTWKSVITKSCEDPKAAFEFFDKMWSEEMQILVNWGIESIHYDVVEGKKVLKDEIIRNAIYNPDWKTDTGLTIFSFWSYGSNVRDENDEYYNFFTSLEFELLSADDETRNILSKYNITSFRELGPEPIESEHTFVWKLNLDYNTKGAFAEAYIDDVLRRIYLPKVVFSKDKDEFAKNWAEFMREIDNTDIAFREKEISQRLRDISQ